MGPLPRRPVSAGARPGPGRSSLDSACAPAVRWQLSGKRDRMISQIEVSTLSGEPRAFSDSIALVLHLADLHVIVQEGDELFPGVLPQPDDRSVPLAPPLDELVQRGPGRRGVDGGVDGLDVAFEGVPVPLGGQMEGVCGSGG
jgi:hypothetical protein